MVPLYFHPSRSTTWKTPKITLNPSLEVIISYRTGSSPACSSKPTPLLEEGAVGKDWLKSLFWCKVQQGCCFYCQADALRRERERERDSLRTTDGRPQCDQIFLAHNVCHNTQHYLELNTEGGEKVCLPFWQTVNWQFAFGQTVMWQFAIW